jgi:hypothetical protein
MNDSHGKPPSVFNPWEAVKRGPLIRDYFYSFGGADSIRPEQDDICLLLHRSRNLHIGCPAATVYRQLPLLDTFFLLAFESPDTRDSRARDATISGQPSRFRREAGSAVKKRKAGS